MKELVFDEHELFLSQTLYHSHSVSHVSHEPVSLNRVFNRSPRPSTFAQKTSQSRLSRLSHAIKLLKKLKRKDSEGK